MGSTWAPEDSEFCFGDTEFKVQRGQAEKATPGGPLGIHIWGKGKRSGAEKEVGSGGIVLEVTRRYRSR